MNSNNPSGSSGSGNQLALPSAQVGGYFKPPEKKAVAAPPRDFKDYSREEVAIHNKDNDAWIIIGGLVLDITEYDEHPGGKKILMKRAGDDGTADFEALYHSAKAKEKLQTLVIGRIVKK